MCPDGSGSARGGLGNRTPSSYFDSESNSDVDFLVGGDGDVWRFPGHSFVLAESSPVFRAMLVGPLASERTIRISDVDPRAFNHLLRFLYCADVQLQSIPTTLATLYAAHKYLVSGLVRKCVEHLDDRLCPSSVLMVLQHIRILAPDAATTIDPWAPSAPPTDEADPAAAEVADISHHCGALLHNCLQMVDESADEVFASEHMDDLSADLLQQLVARPTLALRSEMVLFAALDRWANRESKRRQRPLSLETRRTLLGDARLCVRYLQMNREDLAGSLQSGLLESPEISAILGRLKKRPLPAHPRLEPLWEAMEHPRPFPAPDYIPLSVRSRAAIEAAAAAAAAAESDASLGGSPKSTPAPLSRKERRAAKEQRKARSRQTEDKRERVCTGSCFADAFFTTLACIFD